MIAIQRPAWIDAFPSVYVTIRFGDHTHMPHECRMSLSGKIYLWIVLVIGTIFPVFVVLIGIDQDGPFFGVVPGVVMAVFHLCVFKYCILPYCSYVCVMPDCVVFRRFFGDKEFVLKPGTTFYFKTLRADLDTNANAILNRIYGEDRGLLINIDDKIWLFFVEGYMINGPEFRKRIEQTLSGFRNPAH